MLFIWCVQRIDISFALDEAHILLVSMRQVLGWSATDSVTKYHYIIVHPKESQLIRRGHQHYRCQ